MDDYYRTCAIPKPEPRALSKARRDNLDARDERTCRELTRKRDKGRCRVPGCGESAEHLHHIVYRSKSRARRWLTGNCVWLCRAHHQLEHAGVITISGDADTEIIIDGNAELLKFRL